MNVTNEQRNEIIFDHLAYLTSQVRRLKGLLEEQGLRVPDDLGTLGPCPQEDLDFLIEESTRKHFPERDTP